MELQLGKSRSDAASAAARVSVQKVSAIEPSNRTAHRSIATAEYHDAFGQIPEMPTDTKGRRMSSSAAHAMAQVLLWDHSTTLSLSTTTAAQLVKPPTAPGGGGGVNGVTTTNATNTTRGRGPCPPRDSTLQTWGLHELCIAEVHLWVGSHKLLQDLL